MSEFWKPEPDGANFRPRCVSVDIEIGRDDRIQSLGAVRPDTGRSLTRSDGGLAAALAKLDDVAEGASFVLGHNLIAFDLPHLKAAKPDLRLLNLPAVDTLRLSPLAFPRNPYHSLVKHYQDGGLKSGRRNDPEWDARIALDVFADEREALAKAAPDLLAAWHWLCTPEPIHIGRIQPEIGPVAFQRPLEEALDLVVDLAAQPRHLALGNAGHRPAPAAARPFRCAHDTALRPSR